MRLLCAALVLGLSLVPAAVHACALAATHIVQPIGIDQQGSVWVVHAHIERSVRGCTQHQVLLEQRAGETSTWYDIAPGMLDQSSSAPLAQAESARCKHDAWVPHHMWRAMGEKWLARDLTPLATKEPVGASVKRHGEFVDIVFADGARRTVRVPKIVRGDGDGAWVGARPFVLWESSSAAWVVREAVGSSAMHPLSSITATRVDATQECPADGCAVTTCTRGCVESVKAPSYVRVMNVTSDDHLNMRSEPNASSVVVAALPANATCVRYDGEKTRNGETVWLRVRSGEATGWVSARFVEAQPLGACPI